VRAVQTADHRVALAYAQEFLAGVIQGDDPGDLLERRVWVGAAVELQLHLDYAVGCWLSQHRTGVPDAAVDTECEPHRAVERRWASVVSEAELGRRSEREGAAGCELGVVARW
jgi:hypothetical protein